MSVAVDKATFTVVELTKAQKESRQLVYELVDQRESQWQENPRKVTTGGVGRKIKSSLTYILPTYSRKYNPKMQDFVRTQYVPGANTHFVDDYVDENGVHQKGLKSQGYDLVKEHARAMAEGIVFLSGILDLKKYGHNKVLADFIRDHEDNVEGRTKEGTDPRKNRKFDFRPVRKEEAAVSNIEKFNAVYEATDYIKKLYDKKGKVYTYNRPLLNALCSIFDENVALNETDDAQRLERMILRSNRNPADFISLIEETFNEYRMAVASAVRMDVLAVNSQEAKLNIGSERGVSILKFKKSNDDDRTDEIIHYFLGSEKGKENYRQMVGETDVKKAESIGNKVK